MPLAPAAPRPSPRRLRLPSIGVAAVLVLSGCAEAIPDASPSPTASGLPTLATGNDPRQATVQAEVAALQETVTAARETLGDAVEASTVEDAREYAGQAVHLLTAAEDLRADLPSPEASVAPLLPGPDISRQETIDYGDVLTQLLTAGRAAGESSDQVLDLLRGPVAGDLGLWQRSPGDVLAEVEAAATTDDETAAEEAVLALPGEAARALAWALRAARADSLAAAQEWAGRAVTHLQIILDATEQTQQPSSETASPTEP